MSPVRPQCQVHWGRFVERHFYFLYKVCWKASALCVTLIAFWRFYFSNSVCLTWRFCVGLPIVKSCTFLLKFQLKPIKLIHCRPAISQVWFRLQQIDSSWKALQFWFWLRDDWMKPLNANSRRTRDCHCSGIFTTLNGFHGRVPALIVLVLKDFS